MVFGMVSREEDLQDIRTIIRGYGLVGGCLSLGFTAVKIYHDQGSSYKDNI